MAVRRADIEVIRAEELPYPSLTAALGRMGPVPCLDSTVELTLLRKALWA